MTSTLVRNDMELAVLINFLRCGLLKKLIQKGRVSSVVCKAKFNTHQYTNTTNTHRMNNVTELYNNKNKRKQPEYITLRYYVLIKKIITIFSTNPFTYG